MRSPRLLSRFRSLVIIGVAALIAGCFAQQPVVKQEEADPLNKIRSAYEQATLKLKRPPKSLDELKPHLENADKVVSPNDGEPYEIVWGVDPHKMPMDPNNPLPPIIAYESKGVNGRRMVLTAMGVVPMTEEEFTKAKPGSKR